MNTNKKKCEICFQNENKYKCPKCLIVYCSLNCYKTHKENCPKVEKEEKISQVEVQESQQQLEESTINNVSNSNELISICKKEETALTDVASDFVSVEKLKLLGESDELKKILSNKHLRDLIINLDNNEKKDQEIERLMQEPLFQEFSDTCLKIVQETKSQLNLN